MTTWEVIFNVTNPSPFSDVILFFVSVVASLCKPEIQTHPSRPSEPRWRRGSQRFVFLYFCISVNVVSVSGLFSCRSCLHRRRLTCLLYFLLQPSKKKLQPAAKKQSYEIQVGVSSTLHDVCVKLIRVEFIICRFLPAAVTSPVFTNWFYSYSFY